MAETDARIKIAEQKARPDPKVETPKLVAKRLVDLSGWLGRVEMLDTSVWVDHFRYRNDVLVDLLQTDLALTHRMVLVELACGTPPSPRTRTFGEIALLRSCNQANLDEVINLIEQEKLYGLGY